MKIDNVITLKDGSNYLLLDKTEYENDTYFYAVKTNEENILTEDYLFLKEIIDNNKVCVSKVTNEEIKAALFIIFMNNLGLEIDKNNV